MAEVIPYEFSQTLQGKMITKLLGKVKCVFSQQTVSSKTFLASMEKITAI